MSGLDAALDPVRMAARLAETLGQQVAHITAELLRHKPGRRVLIRYGGGPAVTPPILGKLRTKGPDTRTPALHEALRAQGLDARAPGRVGVPAARGIVAAPALWLQDEVPGRQLTHLLHPGADTGPAARVGAALARLHNTTVSTHQVWTLDDEPAVPLRNLEQARECLPDEAVRLDAIAAAARSALMALGPAPTVGIHRDVYPDQALVDGDTVWLLDLDLYASGDPAIDPGNFLAHLDEHGLRHHDDVEALAAHRAAFLSGYEAARPFDSGRVERLRYVSLARHINLGLRLPGRLHTTLPLIDHLDRSA